MMSDMIIPIMLIATINTETTILNLSIRERYSLIIGEGNTKDVIIWRNPLIKYPMNEMENVNDIILRNLFIPILRSSIKKYFEFLKLHLLTVISDLLTMFALLFR